MVKNVFIILAVAILILLLCPTIPALAQDEGNSNSDVTDAGILPDSNFYFFKVLGRNLQLWLGDDLHKADLALQFANEDAAVVNELAQKNKFQLAVQHSEQFQEQLQLAIQYMERAREQNQDIRIMVMQMEQNHLRQQLMLASALEKAPEAAKEGLLNAIENSSKHVGDAIGEMEGEEALNRFEEQLNQQVSNLGEDTKLRIRERLKASHGKPSQVISGETEDTPGATAESGQGQSTHQATPQGTGSTNGGTQGQGYQQTSSSQGTIQQGAPPQVTQPGNQDASGNSSGKGDQQKGNK